MPTLLPFKINVFLVGMLLAAGLFEKTSQVKRYLLLLLGLAVAGIYMKKFFLVCFIFCCFEAAASSVPRLPALSRLVRSVNCFIGQKVFAFMADVSYGVYLIHAPVLFVTVRLLLKFCPFTDFTPAARFFLCLSVITPIVYTLAFLAFKYIESPGIAWGRKIIKRSSWLNRTTIQSV